MCLIEEKVPASTVLLVLVQKILFERGIEEEKKVTCLRGNSLGSVFDGVSTSQMVSGGVGWHQGILDCIRVYQIVSGGFRLCKGVSESLRDVIWCQGGVIWCQT